MTDAQPERDDDVKSFAKAMRQHVDCGLPEDEPSDIADWVYERCATIAADELAALRAENEDWKQSFALYWAASLRARNRWTADHPDKKLTWPDTADLMVWVMEQNDDLTAKCERLSTEPKDSQRDREMADGCLDMIREDLEALGTDMKGTPPMMYNDAMRATIGRLLKDRTAERDSARHWHTVTDKDRRDAEAQRDKAVEERNRARRLLGAKFDATQKQLDKAVASVMDEFVRCPECDSDIEGSEWAVHLESHGWTRHRAAAPEIREEAQPERSQVTMSFDEFRKMENELAALRKEQWDFFAALGQSEMEYKRLTAKCERLSDMLKIRTAELEQLRELWNEILVQRNVAQTERDHWERQAYRWDDNAQAKIESLLSKLGRAEAKCDRLREALIEHRADLHEGSKRPCPTCRQSAKALGIKVPDQCARPEFDKPALDKEGGERE